MWIVAGIGVDVNVMLPGIGALRTLWHVRTLAVGPLTDTVSVASVAVPAVLVM